MKRYGLAAVTAFLFVLAVVFSADAAVTALDGFNLNVTGGYINAAAVQPLDGKIIIGGNFSGVGGTVAAKLARINPDGSYDNSFTPPSLSGEVQTIGLLPDGRILIGGGFSGHLKLLETTGAAVGSFTMTASDYVNAIKVLKTDAGALSGIIVGGAFTSIGGATRNYIAKLNASLNLDNTFLPSLSAGYVYALEEQIDGSILVGGGFAGFLMNLSSPDGAAISGFQPDTGINAAVYALAVEPNGNFFAGGAFPGNLIRCDLNGTKLVAGQPADLPDNVVLSLSRQMNGSIVAGGFFGKAGSTNRSLVARYHGNGTLDSLFNPAGTGTGVYVALQQSDTKIILAGDFTGMGGISRNYAARVYDNGTVEVDFNLSNALSGTIYSVAKQSDGSVLAGGDFTVIGNSALANLVRFQSNGKIDITFSPGINGIVYSIDVDPGSLPETSDDRIVIGGTFTCAGSCSTYPRNRIARLDNSGLPDSFNPNANGSVYAVKLHNGSVLVGGQFTNIGGYSRSRIARLDSAGLPDLFMPSLNSTVRAIAVQPDGKVILGGSFTISGAINRIARFEDSGALDASFLVSLDNDVNAISIDADGNILAGGAFTGYLRKYNSAGTLQAISAVPNNVVKSIDILQSDGSAVIGGLFTAVGGNSAKNYIAHVDSAGDFDPDYAATTNGAVYAVRLDAASSSVIAGGGFTQADSSARNHLAMFTSAGQLDTTFVNNDSSGNIYALAFQADGRMIIGGDFTYIGGYQRSGLARLNPDGTVEDPGFSPDISGTVRAVAVGEDGNILIGGAFSSVDGTTMNNVARLDKADGSLDPSFVNPAVTGGGNVVNAIAVQGDGNILIGGSFSSVDGTTMNNVARLDKADGSLDLTFGNPAVSGGGDAVNAIAVQGDGNILIGGAFASVGGKTLNNMARLKIDGTLELDTGNNPVFNPNVNAAVNTVALQSDGKILVGGAFTSVNGSTTRNRMARLNTDGTVDLSGTTPFNVDIMDSEVKAIALQADGHIIISGGFTGLKGSTGDSDYVLRKYIARVDLDGNRDTSFAPVFDAAVSGIGIQYDGKIVASGAFAAVDSNMRGGIVRLTNTSAALQSMNVYFSESDPIAADRYSYACPSDAKVIKWMRSLGEPELSRVEFLYSWDNSTWTSLSSGSVARITGGWQISGAAMPDTNQGVYIKARGYYSTGLNNGSYSVIEMVKYFFLECRPEVGLTAITAGDITFFSAFLKGSVQGHADSIVFEFYEESNAECTLNPSVPPSIPALPSSWASPDVNQNVTAFDIGLNYNKGYCYRIKASNAFNTVQSDYAKFTTLEGTYVTLPGTSTVMNVGQPENFTVNDTITVALGICPKITGLKVFVETDYSAISDLTITLGRVGLPAVPNPVNIITEHAACSSSGINAIFDSASANDTCSVAPSNAMQGMFKAAGELSSLYPAGSTDAAGDWQLNVTKNGAGSGTFISWGVIFDCEYTLTVTPQGNGAGTVTSNPAGIDCVHNCPVGATCSAVCSATFPAKDISITVTPYDTQSVFKEWFAGSGTCVGDATAPNPCIVELRWNAELQPTFILPTDFTVDRNSGEGPLLVTLTNISDDLVIASSVWNFGDGTPDLTSGSAAPFTHIFTASATVTLTTSAGNKTRDITVTGACTNGPAHMTGQTDSTLDVIYAAVGANASEVDILAGTVAAIDLAGDYGVILRGGFDCTFAQNSPYTFTTLDTTGKTDKWVVIGGAGSVTFENIIIQ